MYLKLNKMRSCILLTTVALLLLGAGTEAFAGAEVGTLAPDFTLLDTDSVSHTLSDYRGEVVLLFMVGYG